MHRLSAARRHPPGGCATRRAQGRQAAGVPLQVGATMTSYNRAELGLNYTPPTVDDDAPRPSFRGTLWRVALALVMPPVGGVLGLFGGWAFGLIRHDWSAWLVSGIALGVAGGV